MNEWHCVTSKGSFYIWPKVLVQVDNLLTPKQELGDWSFLNFKKISLFCSHEGQKQHLWRPILSKGLKKLAILPNYRHPRMLCIALRPCQKSSVILGIKDKGVLKMIWKKKFWKKFCLCTEKTLAVYILFLTNKTNIKELIPNQWMYYLLQPDL